jgi:hypothetical protein
MMPCVMLGGLTFQRNILPTSSKKGEEDALFSFETSVFTYKTRQYHDKKGPQYASSQEWKISYLLLLLL